MDTSDIYIKMCEGAYILSLERARDNAYTEGDYIYDGKEVHIIGHDYIGVKTLYDGGHHWAIRFALCEELNLKVATTFPDKITIRDGKYVFQQFNHPIWLPRQDQLQEMVKRKNDVPWTQLKALDDFCLHQYWGSGVGLQGWKSMEQLWLAFIIKENHNKVWSNGEWIGGGNT